MEKCGCAEGRSARLLMVCDRRSQILDGDAHTWLF